MPKIACTFFKNFSVGDTPEPPFGAVTQNRALSPPKLWLRAWWSAVLLFVMLKKANFY